VLLLEQALAQRLESQAWQVLVQLFLPGLVRRLVLVQELARVSLEQLLALEPRSELQRVET
jgi:hypothetical protein